MERAAGMNNNRQRTVIAIIIILLFHAVGLAGLAIPSWRPLLLKTVPYHLLLMFVVVAASHRPQSIKFWLLAGIIFLCAFIAEWIGVHKGWLFGHYYYGDTLGFKVNGIPLIIGINWFMLIYSAGVSTQGIKNLLLQVATGATILTLLDVLIEPVAIKLNYWQWQGNIVPLSNYVCWFVLSFVLMGLFGWFQSGRQSIVPKVLLATQFVFFALLNLLLR